jgi:hypothetical protein
MQNEYDDFESEDESNETQLPKELRSLVKKQAAELKELRAQLNSYAAEERKQTFASILKAKGVNEEVAEFIPADVQDEEAITAWLEAKGKVFGYNPEAVEGTPAVTSKPVVNSSLNDLQSMASTPDAINDLNSRLASAKTKEEFAEALKAAHNTIIK